jgi:hypothetical protein
MFRLLRRPHFNLDRSQMPSWIGTAFDRLGTSLLVAAVALTLLGWAASLGLRAAADELYAQAEAAPAQSGIPTPLGEWLASRLTPDLDQLDLRARQAQAVELSRRADRLIEATSVVALGGLMMGLLLGPRQLPRPGDRPRRGKPAPPLA